MEKPNLLEFKNKLSWMSALHLHKNLKFLRKKNGWTQAEMPDKCGISPTTWSNYENSISRPDLETLVAISNIFGVTIDELVVSDLENGNLNSTERNEENGSINSNLNGNLNRPKASQNNDLNASKNQLLEELNSLKWIILNQFKLIDQKLDQIRDLGENDV